MTMKITRNAKDTNVARDHAECMILRSLERKKHSEAAGQNFQNPERMKIENNNKIKQNTEKSQVPEKQEIDNRRVILRNVNYNVSHGEIQDFLDEVLKTKLLKDKVVNVKIPTDHNGRNKGYAEIECRDELSAKSILALFQNREFFDRRLVTQYATVRSTPIRNKDNVKE
ncbi:hypothetical protein RFI_25231 [Reticulomyxa filosa]|uniref:RRM domain-containing protein n=1 Tax=Reticulomyxa filosa TaxID=46433 RepID=X6MGG7_RETFI|nr:hypothetical protein RFI_25231 [Reticulomyxa filosa]|eukprot:ETO12145.1 hypothetical protein RFI_25231 [Reticulomyxa filosa]